MRKLLRGYHTPNHHRMLKSHLLFLLLFLKASFPSLSQCLTAPPAPACTGSEPTVSNNETVNSGTTKWYYGPPATINRIDLAGGTLVVCSDLTIDNFSITGGTIFVRPGAKLTLGSGSGAGLIMSGNSAIYNYGTVDVFRNLSMDAGATAAAPNIIINATPTSVFRVPFAYFVINNPFSWFVNNGSSEFGGVITDQFSSPSSVCLGNGSIMKMNILINKTADAYKVNFGNACVNVVQTSIFNNKLTANPNLYACLSSSHSSYSGCGGCPANNWGSANVITGCASCMALGVLETAAIDLKVSRLSNGNQLNWILTGSARPGKFIIERSNDALHFAPIATLAVPENSTTTFHHLDKSPEQGYNYYMIKYLNDEQAIIQSKAVRVSSEPSNGLTISPMPFQRNFTISFSTGLQPEKIIVTDISGKNIPIRYNIQPLNNNIDIEVLQDLAPGIYILHLKTAQSIIARTIFRQ